MRLPYLKSPVRRFYSFLILMYLAGLLLILWNPETEPGRYSSACFFRNITGIPCPGCGMGRGVVHTFQLDFISAVKSHPFAVLVGLIIIVLPIWVCIDLFRRSKSLFVFSGQLDFYFAQNRWAFWSLMILLVLLWIINIYKFQHSGL